MSDTEAAEREAAHLRRHWTPKNIREYVGFAEAGRSGLDPIAARAVETLKSVGRA